MSLKVLTVGADGKRLPLSSDSLFASDDLFINPEDVFKRYFKGTDEQYRAFLNKFDLNTSSLYMKKSNVEQLPQYVNKFISSAWDKEFIQLFDTRLNQVESSAISRHSNQFEHLTLELPNMESDMFEAFAKQLISTYPNKAPSLVAYNHIDVENRKIDFLVSTLVLYVDESDKNILYTSYESRDKTHIRLANSIAYPNEDAKKIYLDFLGDASQNKALLYENLASYDVDTVKIQELATSNFNDKKFLNELKKSLGIKVDLKKSTNMNLTYLMQHLYETSDNLLEEDEVLVVKAINGQNYTRAEYFYNSVKSEKEVEALELLADTKKIQKMTNLEKRGSMSPDMSKDYVQENTPVDRDNREDTEEILEAVTQAVSTVASLESTDTEKLLEEANKKRLDAFVLVQEEQAKNATALAYKGLEKFKNNLLVSGNLLDNYNKVKAELLKTNPFAVDRFDLLVTQELSNMAKKDIIINEIKGLVFLKADELQKLSDEFILIEKQMTNASKDFDTQKSLLLKTIEIKEQEVIDVEIVYEEYQEKVSKNLELLTSKLSASDALVTQQNVAIEYSKKEIARIPILEKTNDDLKDSLNAKNSVIDDLKDSVSVKEKTIEELKLKNVELDDELKNLKQENHELKSKNDLLSANNDELKKELERVLALVETMKSKNVELDTELGTLKEIVKATKQATAEIQRTDVRQGEKEKLQKNIEYALPVDAEKVQETFLEEVSLDKASVAVARLYLIKKGTLSLLDIKTDEKGNLMKTDLESLKEMGILFERNGSYNIEDMYKGLLFKNYKVPVNVLLEEKAFFDYMATDDVLTVNTNLMFTKEDGAKKVSINKRIAKEEFAEYAKIAQENGGKYNFQAKGFVFQTENGAEDFIEATTHQDDDSSDTSGEDEKSGIPRNRNR